MNLSEVAALLREAREELAVENDAADRKARLEARLAELRERMVELAAAGKSRRPGSTELTYEARVIERDRVAILARLEQIRKEGW